MKEAEVGRSGRKLRVAIGSDDAGADYRKLILSDLRKDARVASVIDVSEEFDPSTPYPDVAVAAARKVSEGAADRAILICGTGIGMAISANKVPGIRATTAHDSYSVERSVMSNNCQILAFGERVIGPELARRLAREWLGYTFDPGSPSEKKVAKILAYERQVLTDQRPPADAP